MHIVMQHLWFGVRGISNHGYEQLATVWHQKLHGSYWRSLHLKPGFVACPCDIVQQSAGNSDDSRKSLFRQQPLSDSNDILQQPGVGHQHPLSEQSGSGGCTLAFADVTAGRCQCDRMRSTVSSAIHCCWSLAR